MSKSVIDLAKQSGFWKEHINTWMCSTSSVEFFANLVRNAALEEVVDSPPSAPQEQQPAEVPLLTDDEICSMHHIEEFGLFCDADEFEQIARAIEQAVRQKAGLK